MIRWIAILILFVSLYSKADEIKSEIHPWVSASGIWGQGGAGVAYKKTNIYSLRYDFVLDWQSTSFSYHQITPSIDIKNYTIGFKYINQLSQDEYTPYIGHFKPFYFKYPVTIYNEAEYRINSVAKDEDYVRTRHIVTLYESDKFLEKYYIRPYVSIDSCIDWYDDKFEKNRLSVGYFFNVGKFKIRVYAFIWSNGIKEKEWDDRSKFGATALYEF